MFCRSLASTGILTLTCVSVIFAVVNPVSAEDAPAAAAEAAHEEAGHDHPVEGPMTAHKADVDLAIFSVITFGVFLFVL